MKRNSIKFTAHFVLFPLFVFGATFPEHEIETISVEGEIQQILCEDLNADGTADLLILHTQTHFPDTKIRRLISLFFQKNGELSETADQTIEANNEETVFDLADLDHDGKLEFIFLKEDGCYLKTFGDSLFSNQTERIIQIPSLFLSFDKSRLTKYPLCFDLNGDSLPEIFIPQMHGIDIVSKTDTGYAITDRLWMNQPLRFSDHPSLSMTISLPGLTCQDFNGDGRPDLLFIQNQQLYIFLNHFGKSSEGLIPPDLHYNMRSRHLIQSSLNRLSPSETFLEIYDLNDDGFSDLLLIQAPRAQFPGQISQIQIYINRYGKLRPLPDQILTAENFGGEHIVRDFNRDGLLDIATLNFDIGILQAARFILTKKVKNICRIYLMRPDHTYPDHPDSRISFRRKLTLLDLTEPSLYKQSFEGDFNGDGLSDFLAITESDRFVIYTGTENGQFPQKAADDISTATSEHFLITDFNRDGCSDLILWFPEDPDKSGQIVWIKNQAGTSP
jgi:hypothetical protein